METRKNGSPARPILIKKESLSFPCFFLYRFPLSLRSFHFFPLPSLDIFPVVLFLWPPASTGSSFPPFLELGRFSTFFDRMFPCSSLSLPICEEAYPLGAQRPSPLSRISSLSLVPFPPFWLDRRTTILEELFFRSVSLRTWSFKSLG